jgi:hypothetical protein
MLGPIEGEGYWEVLSWCATPGVTEQHRFITYEEAAGAMVTIIFVRSAVQEFSLSLSSTRTTPAI